MVSDNMDTMLTAGLIGILLGLAAWAEIAVSQGA